MQIQSHMQALLPENESFGIAVSSILINYHDKTNLSFLADHFLPNICHQHTGRYQSETVCDSRIKGMERSRRRFHSYEYDSYHLLGKENGSRQVAEQLAADYQTMYGKQIPVVPGKGKAGDFVLQLKADKKLGNEGYAIQIKDRVILTAPTTKGLFWATRTLLQLAEQDEQQALPKGEIRDFPDYAIRGFMLDCGRKFIPMSFLRDYVRIMSYYKMNTFQIHLNDNAFKQYFEHDWMKTYAAFRLESETFPGLAAPDGHYTKKEFIELQLLADSLGVEIIPEIDVPAHSLAFTQYCPEIGSQEYGLDHLDLFNPKTYEFVDALFKEYLEGENPVFRGPRVHIGTDEYSNKKKDVVEKFRAFTDHYIRYVESFGKQACVWGALTHAQGDTPVKSEMY